MKKLMMLMALSSAGFWLAGCSNEPAPPSNPSTDATTKPPPGSGKNQGDDEAETKPMQKRGGDTDEDKDK